MIRRSGSTQALSSALFGVAQGCFSMKGHGLSMTSVTAQNSG